MYGPLTLALKYIRYWIVSKNGKGHGIHSPFVFDLVTQVLNDKGNFYCYTILENLRNTLKHSNQVIDVVDFGAGSRMGSGSKRAIRDIARNALKPKKYSQLLFRLANYFTCSQILELGTSLGITTGYLAHSAYAAQVTTLEGSPEIAAVARHNFSSLGLQNIRVVTGNFDETLAGVLKEMGTIDLCYIDGNHRYEPTVRYFRQILPYLHPKSVLVFDDIHWSREMEQAWAEVKRNERVRLTIDLFFIGMVFFTPDIKVKQDFTIRY